MEDGLLGIGAIMLSRSQRRLETVTANVANMSTPGFKKQRIAENFADTLGATAPVSPPRTDFTQGSLRSTTGELDLAISGTGFFQVRDQNGDLFFTRSGQFSRGLDNVVTDGRGMALVDANGGDIKLPSGTVEVSENGTIIHNGRPIARIALYTGEDGKALPAYAGSLFTGNDRDMVEVANPLIRQGKLENANVEMSFEMTEVMSAMRQAETGSRIIQTFDALMGQTISTFGRGGR